MKIKLQTKRYEDLNLAERIEWADSVTEYAEMIRNGEITIEALIDQDYSRDFVSEVKEEVSKRW